MIQHRSNLLALVCGLAPLVGCHRPPPNLYTPHRLERGLVLILPGIEGLSPWNRDLAVGLERGGVNSAIEVYDWTTGLPGGFVLNLTDLERNRQQAAKIAEKIVQYQADHEGRPVHVIGHSGGGGLAVLGLESLPAEHEIELAILLAPALGPEYDLSAALRRSRQGIVNFYSENDVSFLQVGTSLLGTIERTYDVSAGAVGFRPPPNQSAEDHELYMRKFRQVSWNPRLRRFGASGTHIGWASRQFGQRYLADLIRRNEARHPLAK